MKKRGFNTETVQSLNIRGIKNGDLLIESVEEERILITYDKDFLSYKERHYLGIIILDIHPAKDENVIPHFNKFLDELDNKKLDLYQKIIILKETGFEYFK